MLPAFASISDLEARMGPSGDATRAQAALDDASSAIRDVAGKSWVDETGALDLPAAPSSRIADTLLRVCCAVARRILENPEGASAESIASFSHSLSNTSNDVYLTSAERRAVRIAAGTSGLRTIQTTRSEVGPTGIPYGLEIDSEFDDYRNRRDKLGPEVLQDVAGGEPVPWTDVDGF